MKFNKFHALVALLGLPLTLGCGSTDSSTTPAHISTVSIDKSLYVLEEEPDGAIDVITARETAEDGKPVVIFGRIGGSTNPWIEGRAAFTLLDASMTVVAEGESSENGEICLDDCCAAERLDCTTLVKVVDKAGQLLAIDSRQLLEVNEDDMVVVQGIAMKDKSGNFSLLANGVYVRR